MSIPLGRLEEITDGSGAAPRTEALLPVGVRHRQLRVRTLLLGMQLALADRRPAYLTEVHAALIALPEADQVRLGVTEDWETGPHLLTYRQVERTFGLVADALAKTASRRRSLPRSHPGLRRPAGGQHPATEQGRQRGAGGGLGR